MNYGKLIYNKKMKCLELLIVWNVSIFRKSKCSNAFWHFGVFCTINCYFEFGIRIRCIFLYIGSYFKDIFKHLFQKCHSPSSQFPQPKSLPTLPGHLKLCLFEEWHHYPLLPHYPLERTKGSLAPPSLPKSKTNYGWRKYTKSAWLALHVWRSYNGPKLNIVN